MFRELNKSASIRFPIKENVSNASHKISIMIQVQLGGNELPKDQDFNLIRRQYLSEKQIVFDRISRLVRCVVDCKAHDCDGPGTRNALELARSLAAEYWEGTHNQLRQVPQVGPVLARKLVQANIKTIKELAAQDSSDVERICSKNPPFGKKIIDAVAAIPKLSLKAEITGKILKKDDFPKVRMRVNLQCANFDKMNWKRKSQTVTFISSVSNGILSHIWRGGLGNLEKSSLITFEAKLTTQKDSITCLLACDDIVGTMKRIEIVPDLPVSAYPFPIKTTTDAERVLISTEQVKSNYDDDEIADIDLLAAAECAESSTASKSATQTARPTTLNDHSREFIDIDDDNSEPEHLVEEIAPPGSQHNQGREPERMANGKWKCLHACNDNGRKKDGKLCTHKCCREGLDKPRKASQKRVSPTEIQPKIQVVLT